MQFALFSAYQTTCLYFIFIFFNVPYYYVPKWKCLQQTTLLTKIINMTSLFLIGNMNIVYEQDEQHAKTIEHTDAHSLTVAGSVHPEVLSWVIRIWLWLIGHY